MPSCNLSFPNTYGTISEVAQFSFWQILVSNIWLNRNGPRLFAWFTAGCSCSHPVIAVAFTRHWLALHCSIFVIGNRAIFFSPAPMMWFGFAFIVGVLCSVGSRSLPRIHPLPSNRIADKHTLTTFLATILALLIGWVNSPTNYVPKPSFGKESTRGLYCSSKVKAKSRTDIVVASWWDYG